MEHHVKDILKIGIKAISFIDKQFSHEKITSHPVVLPEYFTIKS